MDEEQRVRCGLPPKEKTVIAPEGGWRASTYYVVDVAYSKTNPIHRAIFYSGFLNGNSAGTEPGGYNAIWNASYEVGEQYPVSKCHYLKVIAQIEGIR